MSKLFKDKPINGNSIVAEIQARRAMPGSSGRITDHQSGQVLAERGSSKKPKAMPSPREEVVSQPVDEQEVVDQGFDSQGGNYMEDDGGYTDPDFTADDAQEASRSFIQFNDDLGSFMKDRGIDSEEMYQSIAADMKNYDVEAPSPELVASPELIRTGDDADKVGMFHDILLDKLGLDAEKYFTTGELEECGAECQERQQMMEAQAEDQQDG